MAAQAPALQASSPDVGACKRTWFFQGIGVGALTLLGVYSLGGLRFHHESPSGLERPLGQNPVVAFNPVLLGARSRGFRPPTREPVSVSMNGGHSSGGQDVAPDPKPTAYAPNDSIDKQQAAIMAMSLASQQQYLAKVSAGDSMAMLATAAMYSAGDPSKLASVFQMMPEEDYQLYERMQDDVWARAQSMPGITEPLGFFDPLGFCADCSEGRLCFYREVEVKHGRVAMLASLGIIVAEQFHPFFVGWKDLPSSIAWEQVSLKKFWEVLTVSIAIPEMLSVFTFNAPWEKVYSPYGPVNAGLWSVRSSTVNGFDRVPGDLGFDPLDLKPRDPREYHEMLTMELNNGRLAMIAATGMLVQEMVTGRKIF